MTWTRDFPILGVLCLCAPVLAACGDDEPATFECGDDLTCKEGQVCVQENTDLPEPRYHCADDPCGSAEPSCDCVASVCEIGSCTSASERKVTCVCLVC
jgi:hypothetical protein